MGLPDSELTYIECRMLQTLIRIVSLGWFHNQHVCHKVQRYTVDDPEVVFFKCLWVSHRRKLKKRMQKINNAPQ